LLGAVGAISDLCDCSGDAGGEEEDSSSFPGDVVSKIGVFEGKKAGKGCL